MEYNILTKISQTISANLSDDEILSEIKNALRETDKIYSYLIRTKCKNNVLQNWHIEYNISQDDKYNDIRAYLIVEKIFTTLIGSKNATQSSVIGYKQSRIETMLTLYKPLMRNLALEQCERWRELEYEDALSTCQLLMLKLHSKGYYIHKRLLKRSFENEILMQLRHSKNKPEILSLDQVMHSDGDSSEIVLGDMLPYVNAEIEAEKRDDDELIASIFEEVKRIIIELIGERQFEQLLRDYGQKHTTSWSCKKMRQIKQKFNQLGITWKSLEEK